MTRLTRYSPARATGVTLGLATTGAILGGAAWAIALGIGLLCKAGLDTFSHLRVLLIPGAIGAVLGSVCAPLAGWLLFRRVPLGRAFAGLVIGTVLGGLSGWFPPLTFNVLLQPIATAAAGFVAAALVMRRRYRGDHPQHKATVGAS
jgi:hypothetical protein